MAGNIPIFDAGNLALRPTETGVEARAGTARRVGMFYNQQASAEDMLANETSRLASQTQQVGSETRQLGAEKGAALADAGRRFGSDIEAAGGIAVKALEHQDISQATPAFAKTLQKATDDWNTTVKSADPNDPHVATKFMESLEGDLTNFKEQGFTTDAGRQWAQAHTDALRQHMAEKTQADMATLAGQAAVTNQQKSVNALSATVHGDPSSLDFSLAALRSGTEGMISSSPNLTGTQAAAARQEILQKGSEAIVKSAAIGYIEKTGKVPPWATDPKYAPYINGAELKTFEGAARTQQRMEAAAVKADQVAQKQIADLKVHAGATKTITDNVSIDPNSGKPIINPKFFKDTLDIARNNPDAPSAAATARTMMDWGESQTNKEEKIVDDPTVKQDLTDRLFDPTKPTTTIDLMKAQVQGKLSDHSFRIMDQLVKEQEQGPMRGPIYQDAMASAKEQLGTGVMMDGHTRYLSFVQSFLPKFQAMQRAGNLPPDALDMKNPNSLISKSMEQFRPTPSELLRAHILKNFQGVEGGNIDIPGAPPTANQSTRMVGDVPVPRALNGIAALKFSKSLMQWRDETTGKIYDSKGNEVAK